MKKSIIKYMIAGSVLALPACTDLAVKETDSKITSVEGVFLGVDAENSLITSYADLRGQSNHANTFGMQQGTTDEIFIPTRGTDWGDNGVWRDLASHQWSPAHAYNLGTWNELNSNVFRTNRILSDKTEKTPLQTAEAKFLRAWNMYVIFDFWRQIPFRAPEDKVSQDPKVYVGQEAFDFIEKDLLDAVAVLPSVDPSGDTKHATKAAANFLLAKLYLNKHIYLGTTAAAADMTKVIQAVDAITDDGYDLHDGYFDNFKAANTSEIILWTDASVGNRIWSTLHYASGSGTDNPGGGWNGFATTAEFYDLFEGDANINVPGSDQEERRGAVSLTGLGYGLLIGQQYAADGTELMARAGKKLAFTKEVPSLVGANDRIGVRVIKYHPNDGGSFRSHYILFRYADAYLMKIEAMLRGGTSSDNAETLFDDLRTLRHTATNLTASLDEVLNERARELYMEGWRRTDLVRFGKFNTAPPWNKVADETRNIFPIPDIAVSSNPNLKQNPGY